VLRQVCHSLAEAHARGLVHRDIKPANIFLCRLGPDDDFVKVLDFGLVKHAAPAATVTELTAAGNAAGTPAYMAPEVALASPDIDGRADIYSLGCVAYFLLTGQVVFTADSVIAIALAHVNDQPVPPSARSSFTIPGPLDALILQCLAKDPAERPASAVDLANRLAATVHEDGWTADVAHAWWDQHRIYERKGSAGGAALDEPESAEGRRRCWPRLDSDAPHHRIARAFLPPRG
jgi:serine/threonine-protein kinase